MFRNVKIIGLWKERFILKEKSTASFFKKIERASFVFSILGMTIIQLVSVSWSSLPFVKTNREEEKVEQLKVSQNYEYVEQLLGKPMVKEEINLPLCNKRDFIIGNKAIFCSRLYTIITYFDDYETLQGYFLISHKKSFAPKMFRDEKLIDNKLSNYTDNLFGGYLAAISKSYGSRRDGSSHFMKYYTHHLATNGCLIGIGVSSLGFYSDIENFFSLAGDEKGFISGSPLDYNIYKYIKRDLR